MSLLQRIMRHGLLVVAFLVLYMTLTLPGVIFLSRNGFTAWYPAIGLIIAILLGVNPWYGLLVVVADLLSGRLIYHQSLLSYEGLLGSAGSAICYVMGAFVLQRRLPIDQSLARRQDVVRYLLVSALAAAGSTLTGVTCLWADGTIGAHEYWKSMGEWFIGDGIGVVGVAPFLLIFVLPWIRKKLEAREAEQVAIERAVRIRTIFEVTAQIVALVVVPWIMFDPRFGTHKFFLGLVPVVWIAMRFGTSGAAAATLALNFGVMTAIHIFPPNPNQLETVGLLMLVVSSVGLVVGSSVSERERISRELSERTSYLDSVIENSPFGLVVLDDQGRVKFVNRAFEELTLTTHEELAGCQLDSLFSAQARSDMPEEWYARTVAGHTLHHSFTWGRKDGSVINLHMDAVPLTVGGRLRGAYIICKDISQEMLAAEAERKHTESLNGLVCALEVRTSQMTVLNEMGSLLECCATMGEAGEVTARSMEKLFPEAASGAFFMSEKSACLLEAVANWGPVATDQAQPFAPQDCWAIRRGRAHWSAKGEGLVCQHLHLSAETRFLCLPLAGKEGTTGILQLEFSREESWMKGMGPDGRQQAQEGLALTVAAQLEHSIASLKLREALRDQSIRDPLTGLYNRRFMEESLERELMRASRNGKPLALLFIDLDHFKRFNDSFGHDAGDFVLRTMANVFRDFFRGNDLICRYGGEEFAIGLPECNAHDAAARADELRARVRSTPLKYESQTLLPVTLSVGVSAFPANGSTVADVLRVADECLYRSKSSGRDTTTEAPAFVARRVETLADPV